MSKVRARSQSSKGEGQRRGRRSERFSLREGLWKVSSCRRLRACGRRRIDSDRAVQVLVADGVAHTTNLQLCGSVHACPVCAPRIRSVRAEEIEAALGPWLASGGGCEFVTCTLPHDMGDRLAALLVAVRESWSAVLSGRAWSGSTSKVGGVRRSNGDGLRHVLGVEGTIRALEVTYGEAGWHPHVHVLMLTAAPLDDWQRALLQGHVAGVWGRSIGRYGYRLPSEAHGVTVSPVTVSGDVARYMAKVEDEAGTTRAVGNEMARHDFKVGRRKGRAPFEILAGAVLDGDADDGRVWREYEKAIKGQRAISWSKGLKDRLRIEEVSDEGIVDAPVGGDLVVTLSEVELRSCLRTPGGMAGLLDAAEEGTAAVAVYLRGLVDRYRERSG